MEQFLGIVAFINDPALQQNAFVASLRWLFLMVSVFFSIIIVYGMSTTTWRDMSLLVNAQEFLSFRPRGMRRIGKQWKKIMARLETDNEAEYKLAVIEADTILADALQKMHLSGDTIDQRLQQVTKIMMATIDDVKDVHQIRNSIVYDPDYRITQAEARRVLEIYETAFRGLDLMD